MPTHAKNVGLAVLAGAGSGAEGLVSQEAIKWLSRCEVLLYDRLTNPALLNFAPTTAERIDVGKSPGRHSTPQEQINALLVEKVREGKLVVRLKGGDPLIFGRGGEEADALAAANLPFRIVPGITAAVAAGAYAGVSLTDRRHAATLAFVTGHEDPTKGESRIDYDALAGIDTVVFYMGVGRLGAICERLCQAGKSPDTPAVAIENATTPRQRTLRATLATLPDLAQQAELRPPAIVIVGEVAGMTERLGWFERLPLFGRRVLVTRSRRQASQLADALAEQGADVLETPTIDIAPPECWDAMDAALHRLGEFDWLVLTSPNGAAAVLHRFREIGLDARALAGVKLAVVGEGTAQVLAVGNLRADLVPDDFTTDALGQALLAQGVDGRRILLARSDIAPPGLAEALQHAGATVEEVVAYRTGRPAALPAEAQEALQTGQVNWITFTSSSTVENFLTLAGKDNLPSSCKIAAIGPVTAEALRAKGIEPTVIAQPHTIDALVRAMIAVENER